MKSSRVVVLAMLLCAGCCDGRPDRDAVSPAEFFEKTQSGRMTPNGPVVPGSARDMDNGRPQYQTADGNWFEVTPHASGVDTYLYDNPSLVEPQSP